MKALLPLALLAGSFGLTAAGAAPRLRLTWSPETVRQGGVLRFRVEGDRVVDRPEGKFAGKELRFFHGAGLGYWEAWAGVDVSAKPGSLGAKVTVGPRTLWAKVPVTPGGYKVERLTVPKGKVNPTKKAVLDRIWGDRKRAKAAGKVLRDVPFMPLLVVPCEGRKNFNFGKRRILNGTPKSPHSGEDISAPVGTPVRAAAPGVVRLVDDMFYSGKTLFVDHGAGWMTTYFHLSKIFVEPEQAVDVDTVLGEVGATGRVTGPHLHWGLQWLRSRVDPLQLVGE